MQLHNNYVAAFFIIAYKFIPYYEKDHTGKIKKRTCSIY